MHCYSELVLSYSGLSLFSHHHLYKLCFYWAWMACTSLLSFWMLACLWSPCMSAFCPGSSSAAASTCLSWPMRNALALACTIHWSLWSTAGPCLYLRRAAAVSAFRKNNIRGTKCQTFTSSFHCSRLPDLRNSECQSASNSSRFWRLSRRWDLQVWPTRFGLWRRLQSWDLDGWCPNRAKSTVRRPFESRCAILRLLRMSNCL